MNWFYFLALEVGGFLLVKYAKWLRDSTGLYFATAEKVLGRGGTISVLKLFGVCATFLGFYVLVH